MSDTFRALAGLRELDATRRLVAALGPRARAARAERLERADASLGAVIGWLLSDEGRAAGATDHRRGGRGRSSDEFAAELELVRELDAGFPGDPGIVVALLMNLVTLRRGEGLFVPAGVLHAYLDGLGVELMAASDNVLRGGLTPKHVDVAELLARARPDAGSRRLSSTPSRSGDGLARVRRAGRRLRAVRRDARPPRPVSRCPSTASRSRSRPAGDVTVTGLASGDVGALRPGAAVLATPDEGGLRFDGRGRGLRRPPGSLTQRRFLIGPLSQCDTPSARREGSRGVEPLVSAT